MKGHIVVGGLLSPVHASYKFKQKVVDADTRYEMVRAACASSSWTCADAWEYTQQEWSRSLLVLRSTRERLAAMMHAHAAHCAPPSSSSWTINDVDVALCCGSDLLASMALPGVWDQKLLDELLNEFYVIVIPRVGSDVAHCVSSDPLLSKHSHKIIIAAFDKAVDVQPSALSSTMVRRYVAAGRSIKYFVADEVIQVIETKQLFKDGDAQSSSY